jgi:Protein of unknown function (DUF4019)
MKVSLSATLCILAATTTAYMSAAQSQEQSAPAREVAQVVAQSNQDAQWQPVAEQRERVLRDVLTYLVAKDEGRFADAYARFADSQKTSVPFVRWEADMRAFYSSAGQAQGRTLKKVTWYKNPANTQPGIYAAVDFTSQFSELSLHCGFVALRQQMDGSFTVVREEENSISKREMLKLSPDALRNIRAQYRC